MTDFDRGETPWMDHNWLEEVQDWKNIKLNVSWFESALAWVDEALSEAGIQREGEAERLYVKYAGCLFKVTTSNGLYYFKARAAILNRELELVLFLKEKFPDTFPEILGIEKKKNWILLKGWHGSIIENSQDIQVWQKALERFAEIQISCQDHVGRLLGIGLSNLSLERMITHVDALCHDEQALWAGDERGLAHDQFNELKKCIPRIKRSCDELRGFGIPETLEHGDSNQRNILSDGNKTVFLDFTESTVSHPFFSPIRLLTKFVPFTLPENHKFHSDKDCVDRMIRSYLNMWQNYASYDELERAWKIAVPLASLSQGLNYYLLPWTERKIPWERRFVVANNCKALLKHKDFLVDVH